jgi:hypothetical protein
MDLINELKREFEASLFARLIAKPKKVTDSEGVRPEVAPRGLAGRREAGFPGKLRHHFPDQRQESIMLHEDILTRRPLCCRLVDNRRCLD